VPNCKRFYIENIGKCNFETQFSQSLEPSILRVVVGARMVAMGKNTVSSLARSQKSVGNDIYKAT
jgi:hypothetical protein